MFDFDFGLDDDIDLLRQSISDFAANRIAPRAAEIDSLTSFLAIYGSNWEKWACWASQLERSLVALV